MNKTTLGTVLVGVTLLIVASFYFSPKTMPFGMMGDERGEHNETKEHHGDGQVETYEIYPADAVRKIENNEDVVLLDVRTLEEYEEVHLKNSVLLPVQEISQKSLEAIGLGESAKDKEIIIYCRSGARSQTAYNIMQSLGYTNIKSVAGGMIHWEEDRYPFTESGAYTGVKWNSDEQNTTVTVDGPKISFDKTTYDFGVVPQYGGTVETVFTVINEGTEILTIGDITTSCSCTSATISNNAIAPGDSAILTAVFDPDFHAEPLDEFKRTVFIPTNDPENTEAEVSITVDIAEGE